MFFSSITLYVHGGGDSSCTSSIALYSSLSSETQSGLANKVFSSSAPNPLMMFKMVIESITTDGTDINSADIAIIKSIGDAGDPTIICIIQYVMSRRYKYAAYW